MIYYKELYIRIRDNVKVVLDLSNYTSFLEASPFLGLTLGLNSKFTFSRLKVA